MKKCDVIIPIYNAYDDVIECIESVIKNTKFEGNYLYLINDASPDERIKPMLKKYADKYKKEIIYLDNEENLGFVGTVNRGMKESKNDVLLLNSDTEVTSNWLDKMQKCAYSSDSIATVTPLSNNATLASVPEIFVPNDLPKGYTLEEMGKIVEECSFNDYPDLPTGHGFCLYIKREALDVVGFFDQESYGKGYGEENDFCFRCLNYGFRNVLCDNTYILHKESKSFLDSKEALIADGQRVLQEKYPDYKHRLDVWVQNRPIEYIGRNIAFSIGNKLERPNIMFMIHDWRNIKTNLGGTTLHAWDLIKNMRDKFNFHIFTPENGVYKVYSYFENSECEVIFPSIFEGMTELHFYNSEYKKLLDKVIKLYKISFVHIHHIIGHYFDLVDVFKENNIKYMITLHDFYSQCPLINKLYKDKDYCEKIDNQKCTDCLHYRYGSWLNIDSWRKEWQRVLDNAYKIIVPSEATKKEVLEIYANDIEVIEHGIDIKKDKTELVLDETNDIAFIGGIGVHKGSKILEQFINKDMINGKVHLFGKINSVYKASNKHFINHGTYVREDLKDLLQNNNIKLICLFSIWPETYSYTMTEAIACGIPVISFDFGAIAERIKKYNLGWLIDPKTDVKDIADEINKILSNNEDYSRKIDAINKYKIITSKEMAEKYVPYYTANSQKEGFIDRDVISQLMKDSCHTKPVVSYDDSSWVFGTLKWRIISKIKAPRFVKKVYRKIRGK